MLNKSPPFSLESSAQEGRERRTVGWVEPYIAAAAKGNV
jgi:hypothetical protein